MSEQNPDPHDRAEVLDEDVVDSSDDRTGDAYGAALPDFPPDEPVGVDSSGTTPVEEDARESFAERTDQHRSEQGHEDRSGDDIDGEEARDLGPEQIAMHGEPALETGSRGDDRSR